MRIAGKVPVQAMKQIAVRYMGIEMPEIDNWCLAHREEVEMISFRILEKWRNMNPGGDAQEKLHKILMTAASSGIIRQETFSFLMPGGCCK